MARTNKRVRGTVVTDNSVLRLQASGVVVFGRPRNALETSYPLLRPLLIGILASKLKLSLVRSAVRFTRS